MRTIRVPDEIWAELDAEAARQGLARSELHRRILIAYLKRRLTRR